MACASASPTFRLIIGLQLGALCRYAVCTLVERRLSFIRSTAVAPAVSVVVIPDLSFKRALTLTVLHVQSCPVSSQFQDQGRCGFCRFRGHLLAGLYEPVRPGCSHGLGKLMTGLIALTPKALAMTVSRKLHFQTPGMLPERANLPNH